MKDPLNYFYEKYPYDGTTIDRYESGCCYVAVMLKSGRVGVCATLQDPPRGVDPFTLEPDLTNIHHRMIYNAWLNATINKDWPADGADDIFDVIPFKEKQRNVMVGFFRPLVKRFDEAGAQVKVFDRAVDHPRLEPMENLQQAVHEAEQIVLTSTTIFNGTFFQVLSENVNAVPVYLLGPSTLLHDHMFSYPGVQGLFGMDFTDFDDRIADIIGNDGGTRDFNIFATKIYRKK